MLVVAVVIVFVVAALFPVPVAVPVVAVIIAVVVAVPAVIMLKAAALSLPVTAIVPLPLITGHHPPGTRVRWSSPIP